MNNRTQWAFAVAEETTLMQRFLSVSDAENAINHYENEDMECGFYQPNRYRIVDFYNMTKSDEECLQSNYKEV